MYPTALEKMWGYLHDNTAYVSEFLYVTDPYMYASNFIDMLTLNPEVIPMLREKMAIERNNSNIFGQLMRGGYGVSEYRVVRMMQIEAFTEVLERNFPDLVIDREGPKLRRGTRWLD